MSNVKARRALLRALSIDLPKTLRKLNDRNMTWAVFKAYKVFFTDNFLLPDNPNLAREDVV